MSARYEVRTQREAVALALGWDVRDEELSEYQGGRHVAGRTKLWNAGTSYAVAVRSGALLPDAFNDYGPWDVRRVPRWDVYVSRQGR